MSIQHSTGSRPRSTEAAVDEAVERTSSSVGSEERQPGCYLGSDDAHGGRPSGTRSCRWFPFHSYNAPLALVYTSFYSLSASIWQAAVFAPFVQALPGGSNTILGWLSAALGFTSMFAAFIAGAIADRTQNQQMFTAMGGGFSLVAVMVGVYAVYWKDMFGLFIASAVFGLSFGVCNTSVESMLANSTTTGDRTTLYSRKYALQTVFSCGGYILTVFIFLHDGDVWRMGAMQRSIYVGMALMVPAAAACLAMREKWKLGAEAEGILATGEQQQQQQQQQQQGAVRKCEDGNNLQQSTIGAEENDESSSLGGRRRSPTGDVVTTGGTAESSPEVEEEEEAPRSPSNFSERLISWRGVPYFLCATDVVVSFGSGMTVRYFPLFFINEFGITPIGLQGLNIAGVVATTLCTLVLSGLASRSIGRTRLIFATRLLPALLLMYLAIGSPNLYAMAVVFTLRTGIIRSNRGIIRSLLMDHVDKKNRGKWNAVESVAAAGWCGSAVVGGYIVDSKGFQFAFGMTALIHGLGTILLTPALFLVKPSIDRKQVAQGKKENR